MDEAPVQLGIAEGIATIRLSRERKLNAMTFAMIDQLIDAFDQAECNDDVRVIVLTGTGRAFCAGTDLSGRGDGAHEDATYLPMQGKERDAGGLLAIRMLDSRKPIIAAINGLAVGIGASIVLPADIRIASSDAYFGFLYVRRGLGPESCASWFLPRLVGMGRALSWMLTGRTVTVEEAHQAGLVQEIVARDELDARVNAIAREIADRTSPVAVALTRQMLWRMLGSDHPDEANRIESLAIAALGRAVDAREAANAFAEKRNPEFTSRLSEDMPDFYPWWKDRD